MAILHRRQRATVEQIRADLPDAPSPSSVRKLLEIMIERGLLLREYDGPRFVYFPAAKPEDAEPIREASCSIPSSTTPPGSAMAALIETYRPARSPDTNARRLTALLKHGRAEGGKA